MNCSRSTPTANYKHSGWQTAIRYVHGRSNSLVRGLDLNLSQKPIIKDPDLLGQNTELAPENVQVDDKGNPRASRSDVTSRAPTGASIVYVGSVVVKNIGTKTVTAVHWEFLLLDTNAKDPSKRYSVQSKKVIPPGEQAELTKEVTPKGREYRVRLIRIDYSDGSFWEHSQKPGEPPRH